MIPAVDSPAPNFTLANQDGRPVSLADYAGRWLVIYFYPKDDTPGCTVEACEFRDASDEFNQAGIAVVGISRDSPEQHRRFRTKYALSFQLLADPEHGVIEAYGAWQSKQRFGRQYMGIARMTYLIRPDGTIAHIWPRVTPKDHAKEILTTWRDLSDARS